MGRLDLPDKWRDEDEIHYPSIPESSKELAREKFAVDIEESTRAFLARLRDHTPASPGSSLYAGKPVNNLTARMSATTPKSSKSWAEKVDEEFGFREPTRERHGPEFRKSRKYVVPEHHYYPDPVVKLDRGPLSEREWELLWEMSRGGESNKQLARILGVSAETIKTQVRSILGKLNARTRSHAVAIAYREGYIL